MINLSFFIRKPNRILAAILLKCGSFIGDRLYLQLMFLFRTGRILHLKNPRTFNEKIQWLKLYDRKSLYTCMVDKYKVKDYISKIIGQDYIIPTLGVWERGEDIVFDSLPNKFVLKTTNGGGGEDIIICTDKSKLDKNKAIRLLNKALCHDIYKNFREWPYKNVERKIIAETYIDNNGEELVDFKFFCFNGKMRVLKIDFDRFEKHKANYYDRSLNFLPIEKDNCPSVPDRNFVFPSNIEQMIHIAEKIAKGIPFVRVDLYNCSNHIYFSEVTFYPASGLSNFKPNIWDYKLGEYISLR